VGSGQGEEGDAETRRRGDTGRRRRGDAETPGSFCISHLPFSDFNSWCFVLLRGSFVWLSEERSTKSHERTRTRSQQWQMKNVKCEMQNEPGVSPSPRLPVSASPRLRVSASRVSASPCLRVSVSPRLRVSPSPRLPVSPSPCLRVSASPRRGLVVRGTNAVGFEKGDNAFAAVPDAGLSSPNFIGLQGGAVGKSDGDRTMARLFDVACRNWI